jgi:adenylosuccinate synthase
MFVDYLDVNNRAKTRVKELTEASKQYIDAMQHQLGVPINFIGTGQNEEGDFCVINR